MTTIGIIGAGTMGTGIALSSALAGYDVVLYDISDGYLQRAYKGIGTMMDKSIERGKLTHADANAAAIQKMATIRAAGGVVAAPSAKALPHPSQS